MLHLTALLNNRLRNRWTLNLDQPSFGPVSRRVRFDSLDQPGRQQSLVKRPALAHLFPRCEPFLHYSAYLVQLVRGKDLDLFEYLLECYLFHRGFPTLEYSISSGRGVSKWLRRLRPNHSSSSKTRSRDASHPSSTPVGPSSVCTMMNCTRRFSVQAASVWAGFRGQRSP